MFRPFTWYSIPFLTRPAVLAFPINLLSYRSSSLMCLVLLQDKDALEIVDDPSPSFYYHFFLVEKASRVWRPAIDFSSLDEFVQQIPFRMETFFSILKSIRMGNSMVSLDLKDTYFQESIHRVSQKYLWFVSQGTLYPFKVLCFSLLMAPRSLHHQSLQ